MQNATVGKADIETLSFKSLSNTNKREKVQIFVFEKKNVGNKVQEFVFDTELANFKLYLPIDFATPKSTNVITKINHMQDSYLHFSVFILNKRNVKRHQSRLFIIFLNGHPSEASVIDSKYIKKTGLLQDFHSACSVRDAFQKQPPENTSHRRTHVLRSATFQHVSNTTFHSLPVNIAKFLRTPI